MNKLVDFLLGLFGFTKPAETSNNNPQPDVVVASMPPAPVFPEVVAAQPPTTPRLMSPVTAITASVVIRAVPTPRIIRRENGTVKKVHLPSSRTGTLHSFKVIGLNGNDLLLRRARHRNGPVFTRPLSLVTA